jgi:glyoxylase-like metal-dependent hydrolase (beta-lactamase superfamily II)
MDVTRVLPDLYYLRFAVGNGYLWRDADGLTLIDAGPPGSGPSIAAALRDLGHDPAEVRRLILTHGHIDHTGGAADIATWGDVTVLAHRADASAIRGEAAVPAPQLADWERPIFERAASLLPAEPPAPVRVDRELDDGDPIDFGGGAVTVAVPGHTPGSIAIYLPEHRVLFTGDIAARNPQPTGSTNPVILGVFNVDPPQAAASFRRLAGLDTEVACFGHGDPITQDAAAHLRGS